MRDIRWQCRRGMLELDVLFERYLKNRYHALSDEDKKTFATLLQENDMCLYDWLVKEIPCTEKSLQYITQDVIRACLRSPGSSENEDD